MEPDEAAIEDEVKNHSEASVFLYFLYCVHMSICIDISCGLKYLIETNIYIYFFFINVRASLLLVLPCSQSLTLMVGRTSQYQMMI
jgi:hypothetical protein